MKLILVRHAESLCNQENRFPESGEGDPLSPLGISQAKTLADRITLICEQPLQLISSPTLRTLQTAQAIAGKFQASVIRESRLQEIDCGNWQGKPTKEIRNAFPELWQQRKHKPLIFQFPIGESLADVADRLKPFIETIRGETFNDCRTLILVSHSNTLSVLMALLLGWDLLESWQARRGYHSNAQYSIIDKNAATGDFSLIANPTTT